ncbi:MAG: site-2 protease family protein [bacterium]|nr:site-2 protease family protein [bacterium]
MLKKILLGLLCLEICFAVHEGAHLVMMRANGVEVEEMSFGMGSVLYQTQVSGIKLSLRLIPIAAYVQPSQKGAETLLVLPLLNIMIIYLAGVATNLVLASLVFLMLRLKSASLDWLMEFIRLPKNYLLLFKDAFLSMVTFGFVAPKNNGGLVLENQPPMFWRYLLSLNLILGILNLLPAKMLDGGQAFLLALMIALRYFQVSEPSAAYILGAVDSLMFIMLILLILNGLPMQFVKVLNPPKEEEKNSTP